MATCGCQVGLPVVCDRGKELQERETNAFVQRANLLGRRVDDPDRVAAWNRLQESRKALLRHMTGEG